MITISECPCRVMFMSFSTLIFLFGSVGFSGYYYFGKSAHEIITKDLEITWIGKKELGWGFSFDSVLTLLVAMQGLSAVPTGIAVLQVRDNTNCVCGAHFENCFHQCMFIHVSSSGDSSMFWSMSLEPSVSLVTRAFCCADCVAHAIGHFVAEAKASRCQQDVGCPSPLPPFPDIGDISIHGGWQ